MGKKNNILFEFGCIGACLSVIVTIIIVIATLIYEASEGHIAPNNSLWIFVVIYKIIKILIPGVIITSLFISMAVITDAIKNG